MKPGDFFLGIIDFFSTLVPGAIATFLIITPGNCQSLIPWSYVERGSAEGWAVFLIFAYVLGHLIAAVASILLDALYDRIYARWRRASSKYVKSAFPKLDTSSPWAITTHRIKLVVNKSNPNDELLIVAKKLKEQQLRSIANDAKIGSDDISNTFWWAGTIVRAKIKSGASEIDALSAQSKLFRVLSHLSFIN
jgi:hypothetical protein